ncbi:6-phosphogluconolactonase [Mucilaginibacter ginkgonis]|uniref:6-phosphogluconolactonase n=1 Tax=Mucilaginibacter ginkgonis TaxID=2682091 RepID=A0A6I4HYJ9_9SPHI|nr:6-phosphogluconolactonase [Mucilaginibacter ginkgonis]QQL49582.1 6-phosphogluconolactonase [Mucilaginibacter ginkgonis]
MASTVKIFDDKNEISTACAKMFTDLAQKAIAENGKFVVALTGGSSPETLYKDLAEASYKEQIDWSKVFVFWGDERWVPLTDDKSNGKMANRTLLNKVPVPKNQIFYMWADKDVSQYAEEYENAIREVLGDGMRFDLILLGMGPEGHTASLFPYEPVLHEETKLVDAYYLKSQNMYRITFTAPLINKAKEIILMLYGNEKAEALYEVLEGERNPDLYPAQLLNPVNGNITWLIDKTIAKDLKKE